MCLFSYTLGAIYFHDFYRYTLLESALQQAKDDAESMLDAEFEDAKEDFADVLEDEEEEFEDAKEEQEEERGTKRKREVLIIFVVFPLVCVCLFVYLLRLCSVCVQIYLPASTSLDVLVDHPKTLFI